MQPDEKAPLIEHLIELRNRLLKSIFVILFAFVVCFEFSKQIFGFLVQPLRDIIGPDAKMIYTGLHEAFFVYLKVAFFAGLFFSLPVLFIQFWRFIAPGLYENEKRAILPFLFVTPILFFVGGAFAYYLVFPFAFKFFLGFVTENIEALPSLSEYLGLVIKLMFAFGLAFEIPVALLLMIKTGITSSASLAAKRRYAIVLAFILAAILTPPDVFTQVFLAIPILGMYEFSIFWGRIIERKKKAQEAAES